MKMSIDGDACSSKQVRRTCEKQQDAENVGVVSTENGIDRQSDETTIVVNSVPQSSDIGTLNRLNKGDRVMTKEYGLTSLALRKNVRAMSANGFVYTKNNIEMLLQQRYINGVLRSVGIRKNREFLSTHRQNSSSGKRNECLLRTTYFHIRQWLLATIRRASSVGSNHHCSRIFH